MRKRMIGLILCLSMISGAVACTRTSPSDVPGTTDPGTDNEEAGAEYTINEGVRVYLSDRENLFTLQENYAKLYDKSELTEDGATVIEVNAANKLQEIHGFGASFTDTSAHVLMAMPEEERNQAMTYLFDDEKGIGLSIIRNCIGGSDFSLNYYTYDEMPEGEEDWELAHFDFSHDLEEIIPLTKQALEINPDARVILSPWTAPRWMKTEFDWVANGRKRLRPECYDVYARYLAKVVKAYEEAGVPVYAITPQNEPFAEVTWPGMYWEWEFQAKFVNDNLKPALEAEGLSTKILVMDHNYSYHEEADSIMAATMQSADGVAYHDYEGLPEEMKSTAEYFKDKPIYVTEASESQLGATQKLPKVTAEIARALRSGASGYLLWNMALDQNGGPTYNNVNNHCSPLVICNTETQKITYDADYYIMAHFSKFIHDGAVLLDSTDTGETTGYKLVNVVTANPNGSMTAIVVNFGRKETEVCKIVLNNKVLEVTVEPRSVVTLTWDGNIQGE